MLAWVFLITLTVISAIWGYYFLSNLQLDKFNFNGDVIQYYQVAIQKIILLFISFCAFYVVAYSRRVEDQVLLRYWFYGLAFAAFVHLLLYLMDLPIDVKRSGVSKEGNFAGAYYLISFFLMLKAYKKHYQFSKIGVMCSILGVILSRSTSSMILLLVLWIGYELLFNFKLYTRNVVKAVYSIVSVAVVCLAIISLYGDDIIEKLFGEDITAMSFSRLDRLSSISSGINIFENNFLMGVGIQGYAFVLPIYIDDFLYSLYDFSSRRIVNNIYIEILAEQGILGLAVFCYVLYLIMRIAFKSLDRNAISAFGFVSILIIWLAFPTYTVSFCWLGIGFFYRFSIADQFMLNKATHNNL